MTTLVPNQRGWVTLFILLFLIPGNKLFAQLFADFSASQVAGCTPVVVQFTDASKGSPSQWRWELGNGVISTLKNPSTTYFNPGTYKIKLVIRNASGADSIVKDKYISVYPNPVVNFKALDSSGCFPLAVKFTDLSTTAGGTITGHNWDFGDGTLSSSPNPIHTYASAGNFTVTLKTTNSYGCTKTVSNNQYIKITNGVKADFTYSNPGQCKAPITINFSNTSTGPGALTYTWNFGDGSESTDANPVHTYTSIGSYSVSLITVSPQGCSDTIKKENLFSIGSIASDFDVPVSVCEGQRLQLKNSTTPKPGSVVWYFGDGSISTDSIPSKIYSTSGNYTIKLVNDFGGCKDSISKSITVHKKTMPDFTSDKTISCKTPFIVNFTNKTTGTNTYKWEFGDGNTSTEAQPSHIYSDTGSYTVMLVVFNENGCADTLVREAYIKIKKPVISITGIPKFGCNPLTITPRATIVSSEPAVSYLWNFGDGTKTNAQYPSYVYNKAGTYDVILTVTTVNGCTTSDTLLKAVRVGDKPEADFTLAPANVCAYKSVVFEDKSIGKVDEWLWKFGDGETSTFQNPSHSFSDTGSFSVTLITFSNTCSDTLVLQDAVYIRPPISKFAVTTNCSDKFRKSFFDESIGAKTWNWNFGDGITSTEQHPSHTYAKKGSYPVTLVVTNGDCMHTMNTIVKVIDEEANFKADYESICRNSNITFTSLNSNPANITDWVWDFGDGAGSTDSIFASHIYTTPGRYTVSLTITDLLGCVNSRTMEILVYGPTADFAPEVSGACLEKSNIRFTEFSSTDGTNAIVKWVWNYGDGTIDSSGTKPYQHLYQTIGEFTVSLKVTDSFGCTDSLSKASAVVIAKPKAGFFSVDSLSCTNKPVQFTNESIGYDLQYAWSFGDAGTSTIDHPIHHYNSIGVYDVKLLITDKYGCKDSVTKADYINISYPKAAFTLSDTLGACPPLLVKFGNVSSSYTSFQWDFDDGNISDLESPSHYYNMPGIYYPKLTVSGPGGCTAVMSRKVEVRGPKGSFSYVPTTGCKPLEVKFTATTLNRVSFLWDFSDGNTVTTTDAIISHTYKEAGEYVPKLIITDETGCSVPIAGADTIKVVGIKAGFDWDKNNLCNTGIVNFTNSTLSNDLIIKYEWSFGDGQTSNAQDPSHVYASPGVYTSQLIVTTQTGCTDTIRINNATTVFKGPSLTIVGDLEACVPAKLTFQGNVVKGDGTNLSWKWSFGNGQTSTLQNPATQIYNNDGLYKLSSVIIDNNGCKDSVSKDINIHPLPLTSAGTDALVCRGNTISLQASGAVKYVWSSSPQLSCTNCANPVAAPDNTTIYAVTGTTAFGCSRTDSVKITVRQKLNLAVHPGDTICVGESVGLWATGADKYTWYPTAGIDQPNTAKPKAKPTAITTYTVIGKDNDNCFTDTATVLIKVNPLPAVDAGADLTMSAGGFVQLNTTNSNDVVSWRWTPGASLNCIDCPAPLARPKAETNYQVQVKNKDGCIDSDDVLVSVICNNGNLFIPNTFSPNGDGSNDRFYPRGTGIHMIRALRIFNRWGELVFEKINFNANDATAGWDGTYKGQKLSADVYIYSCEVVCENNEVLPFKGDITLLQ
jgi:gliding motility-associated-like protein